MTFELCALCGGQLIALGQLGNLLHLRCRNCGGTFSDVIEDEEA